ncbi:DUF6230 family protein [Streptomyces sp. NPDC057909]|uniref:DUF6230 family protein n=1 Tax=Streptomyces sp. NPDC057909 TaxID=3346277 RepID=UPI0036F08AA3
MALVMVPTLAVSGAVLTATARGALAASVGVSASSFPVSGRSFQVSADVLKGWGFVQFGVLDQGPSGVYPEVLSGIGSADLYHLCQSVVEDVPLIGKVTLRLTAGGGSRPAHADRLIVHAHDLRGDVVFENVQIGRDASTLTTVPGVRGPVGGFGQQADSVRIDDLRQVNRSVSAATFRLPDAHLAVEKGDHSCF